jgi:hypothetical protein
MSPEILLKEFSSLPAELQKAVMEYIRYLRQSKKSPGKGKSASMDDFFGMWKDNTVMEDSSAWVKGLRVSESKRKYE